MLIVCLMLAITNSCNLPQTKKLERQNSQLKISLEQCQQEKTQIEDKISQQEKTIIACRENLVKVQQEKALIENDAIQLRKQIELCQAEIAKQKTEKEKFAVLTKKYEAELEKIKKKLKKAQETIKLLAKQIENLKKTKNINTTKPIDK